MSQKGKGEVISIFESENSVSEISIFLKRFHRTVNTFIRRYLLRGELENCCKSVWPIKLHAEITEN